MAGTGSSSNHGHSVFSLDSQAGVMQLLASVRASELSPNIKNELRDLVFLYTNGGHDESVRITLEQKLTSHAITPVALKVAVISQQNSIAKPKPTIGSYRNAPSFTVQQHEEKNSTPEQQLEVEPITKPTPAPESAAVVISQPEPEEKPPIEMPVNTLASETASADSNLERIREIKASVNEKVGNPVHLVDINPDLGREYMSALLEAMKKINSGSAATSAMSRLEKVYQTINSLSPEEMSASTPAAQPHVSVTQDVPMSSIANVASRANLLNDEEETTTPTPTVTPVSQPPVSSIAREPERVVVPPVVETPSYHEANTQPVTPPISARVPISQSPHDEKGSTQLPINSTQRAVFATDGHDERRASPPPVMPIGQPVAPNPPPVSPISVLSNPLMKGKGESASNQTDLLYGPEVDRGLEQLLEEWPIFKKSGLFGTGPKGREHPLFKKVSGLQIPLLLAGRFEGATQEIKQSITDYMNGWRYEQGLIYEQNETFEHYLRRVIRHILDLQKSRM